MDVPIETENLEEKGKKMMFGELQKRFNQAYNKIILILKKYCDLTEDNYKILSIWGIATHLHKQFPTFPYLFFHAMKGSGKTRLLKLMAKISWNGVVLNDLNEAVLFRTANQSSFFIDEFERLGGKEKGNLRLLLNSAYKKGIKVKRAYKWKGAQREGQAIEEFDVYCPVAMANIWGMEEVLADRCIIIILDRSSNKAITRKVEDFETNPLIQEIKQELSNILVYSSEVYSGQNDIERVYGEWNNYIDNIYIHLYTPTLNYTTLHIHQFFEKIAKTSLEGRHLELFFPLFIISWFCGILDEIIVIAERIIQEKKEEDVVESKDVLLLKMLSEEPETDGWISIKSLAQQFKELNDDADWITSHWVGVALRRLNLIHKKRRLNRGMEVILDFKKAQEKIKAFNPAIIEAQQQIDFERKLCPLCDCNVENSDWNFGAGSCIYCNPLKTEVQKA